MIGSDIIKILYDSEIILPSLVLTIILIKYLITLNITNIISRLESNINKKIKKINKISKKCIANINNPQAPIISFTLIWNGIILIIIWSSILIVVPMFVLIRSIKISIIYTKNAFKFIISRRLFYIKGAFKFVFNCCSLCFASVFKFMTNRYSFHLSVDGHNFRYNFIINIDLLTIFMSLFLIEMIIVSITNIFKLLFKSNNVPKQYV
jgi:hypothetical protein